MIAQGNRRKSKTNNHPAPDLSGLTDLCVMTYMIVEKYRSGKSKDVYHRFAERGRMLPDDVTYINSWISEDLTTCYQVLEAPGIEKIEEWISNWNDLVDFEVIPVISSAQAKEKIAG